MKKPAILDRIKITFLNGTILQLPKPSTTELTPKELEKSLAQLEKNKLIVSAVTI